MAAAKTVTAWAHWHFSECTGCTVLQHCHDHVEAANLGNCLNLGERELVLGQAEARERNDNTRLGLGLAHCSWRHLAHKD